MAKSLSVRPLHSLPPELVRNVLEGIDREDLFNLRITCKAMNCYASLLAFKELHVWFEEQSLQRLVNIADNPILCKNVRKVVIGMDYFYSFNYGSFKKYVFLEDNIVPKQSEGVKPKDAWHVYRTYYLKQCALEESGRDLAMMTQALRAFSSLVSVKLMDYQPWVGNKGPRLLRTEKLLRKDMLTVPNESILIPRGGQQLRVLLQALAASGRKVEELSLHKESRDISHKGFYGPLPAAVQAITVQALASLKRLYFIFDPIRPNVLAELKEKSQESSLTTILRAATRVEGLWLELAPQCDEPWNNYIQIPRVGQLKELYVTETHLHETDFALFLRSSCQGLRKLTLGDAKVEEKSWDLIFETIRSLPGLETIELYSLWHRITKGETFFLETVDPQPLYDYLLRRRNDSPWDSMCQAEWDQYVKENPDSNMSESE